MFLIGHTLVVPGNTSQDYFTPWFPRVADDARFTFEEIYSTASSVTVTVYHKSAEDAGDEGGSSVASFSSQLSPANVYEASCSNLKELVRFKVTIGSETSAPGVLRYRFLPPTWFSKAV